MSPDRITLDSDDVDALAGKGHGYSAVASPDVDGKIARPKPGLSYEALGELRPNAVGSTR